PAWGDLAGFLATRTIRNFWLRMARAAARTIGLWWVFTGRSRSIPKPATYSTSITRRMAYQRPWSSRGRQRRGTSIPVDIGGKPYILPVRSETELEGPKFAIRNAIEFRRSVSSTPALPWSSAPANKGHCGSLLCIPTNADAFGAYNEGPLPESKSKS